MDRHSAAPEAGTSGTAGSTGDARILSDEQRRLYHFRSLSREVQAQTIRRLAYLDQTDDVIAHATGLSVEMVRHIMGARE